MKDEIYIEYEIEGDSCKVVGKFGAKRVIDYLGIEGKKMSAVIDNGYTTALECAAAIFKKIGTQFPIFIELADDKYIYDNDVLSFVPFGDENQIKIGVSGYFEPKNYCPIDAETMELCLLARKIAKREIKDLEQARKYILELTNIPA